VALEDPISSCFHNFDFTGYRQWHTISLHTNTTPAVKFGVPLAIASESQELISIRSTPYYTWSCARKPSKLETFKAGQAASRSRNLPGGIRSSSKFVGIGNDLCSERLKLRPKPLRSSVALENPISSCHHNFDFTGYRQWHTISLHTNAMPAVKI